MSHPPQPRRQRRPVPGGPSAVPPATDGDVALDLLRADLYRMLDELARARGETHHALVLQFERAWQRFKEATAVNP